MAIRRAFRMMGGRLRNTFADTPYLFFVVVIGVALTFRLGIGALRSSSTPEAEAPVFASTEAAPSPSARSANGSGIAPVNDSPAAGSAPSTTTNNGTVTNTAAGGPAPARTTPRPRGHGRRSPHGG